MASTCSMAYFGQFPRPMDQRRIRENNPVGIRTFKFSRVDGYYCWHGTQNRSCPKLWRYGSGQKHSPRQFHHWRAPRMRVWFHNENVLSASGRCRRFCHPLLCCGYFWRYLAVYALIISLFWEWRSTLPASLTISPDSKQLTRVEREPGTLPRPLPGLRSFAHPDALLLLLLIFG